MDDIDTEILREIQRKLTLRQLELKLEFVIDRAISNFQRKLTQGLKELSKARVAKVEDASVKTEIEESSVDSEGTTIAININKDASILTNIASPEYSESCIDAIVENPSKMEDESESTETGDFIHNEIPTTETKLLTLPATTLVPIESSNAFLLEGPKLSTGWVVEPYFVLNIFTQKSTSMVGFEGLPLVTMELPLDVFIRFRPGALVLNYLTDFDRKSSLIIHVCKLFDEMPEPDIALRTPLFSDYYLIGNIQHIIFYNAIVMRFVTSPWNGIVVGCSLLFEAQKFMCASIVCGTSVGLLQFGKQVKHAHALRTRGSSERDLCGCSLIIEGKQMCYGMNEGSGVVFNEFLMQYLYGDMLMLGNLVKIKLDEFKDASIYGPNFFRQPCYELDHHDKLKPAWFMASGIILILVAKTLENVIVLIVVPSAEPNFLKSHMLGANNVLGGVPCFILGDKDDFMEGGYMHRLISHFSLELGKSSRNHVLKEPCYDFNDDQFRNILWWLEIVMEPRKGSIVKINCADGVDLVTCWLGIEQLSPTYDAIGLIIKEPFVCLEYFILAYIEENDIRIIARKSILGVQLQMKELVSIKMLAKMFSWIGTSSWVFTHIAKNSAALMNFERSENNWIGDSSTFNAYGLVVLNFSPRKPLGATQQQDYGFFKAWERP
ncbi:hypothetical protein CCACVL1_02077 [Corchorus capsularis]|uniref:Uncharacterized protein n=1 Tax=Corchorus capsularis TaxID=210143 RepID=A0A1R3KD36_COCAP|nr:hypothetical protein CCACVL1_02077 [Corchorus capsularis]